MASTQVVQRQIADGSINDAKVAAGAAIATSKLALNGTIVLKDGSVAMTGALNMGSQLISSLSTPSASTDAATKGYVDTQIGNLNSLFDSKGSARAATTANGTLASAFANASVIDGVTLATGDRILLKNQSAPAENVRGRAGRREVQWTRGSSGKKSASPPSLQRPARGVYRLSSASPPVAELSIHRFEPRQRLAVWHGVTALPPKSP